ncbi:hypothetical protein NB717_002337 [Xanthomonas sacchari]|nr:hypothetical protein [Xanthomonas sacchari]MCW0461269.1 hypothetical protein [Xanthomonas sacchari]MCW0464999.1 hypothetical protein [Xanthomonas sacchari]
MYTGASPRTPAANALRNWVMACVTTSLVGCVSGQTCANSASRSTT